MNCKTYRSPLLVALMFLLGTWTLTAQDLAAGKQLFLNNCATCHAGDMKNNLTGPALGGSQERWAGAGGDEALYAWIRNSQGMIAAGENARAKELWATWGPVQMNSFLNLTDEEIANVLAYIDIVYKEGPWPKPEIDEKAGDTASGPVNRTPLFIGLAVLLGLLAVILARVASNLSYMIKVKETGTMATRRTLFQTLTSRGVVSFVIFALVVLGGYTTVSNAVDLGRQQGYQPEQPIKFSHVTHAGIHQIDCQYCHDGARRSKQSVIPAANTCMNCHKAIKVGSTYGTGELTKIFASIGYDPTTDKYIENYQNLSNEEVLDIYRKWIESSNKEVNPNELEGLIDDQLKGIEEALTNEETGDEKIAGPIEWVRIHNLPDHAYFNHAQHVSVGKVECQTCHGPVQEMEVVKQWSPLSMGWCVNCHRQTEVKFADNEYYQVYEKYHQEIQSGERKKVTVEDIGGLECQKCHY